MSRYRMWIITGLAVLSWLLFFAVGAVVWNGISGSKEPVQGAEGRALAQVIVSPDDPG